MNELQQMIDGTVAAYRHDPRELRKALQAIQWRLVDADRRSVCLGANLAIEWCAFDDGIVFDGRDNQEHKRKFYSIVLKTPLSIEILPQIVCAS